MADLRLGWVTAIDVVRQVLTALAIVGLAVAGATLLPFYAIAPLAGAVAVGLTAWRVRRSVPLLPALHVAEWRSLLVQTLPFALATAVTAVYFRLGILVVNQLSNAHQTGLFGASFRIIEVLIIVPQMMVGAVLPIFARAARDDHDRLAYGLGLVVQVSLIAGILVAGGFVIAAPVVIDIVAGPGFSGAVPVLRLHAVALFFSFAGAPYSYALLSLHHHRSILLASATGLVTMIVALVVLVPSHGAEGAAIGMVIGEAVLWLTGLMLVRRSGLDVRVTRPWRLAAAAAVAAIPGILLGPIAGAVVALPLFAGLVLALGAVPRELLDALPARLRSIP
jgi:O-antigen/teichoic acid export membrane protein